MAQETVQLAEYAAALRYQDLPAPVVQQAKECIIDTVAAGICAALPRTIAENMPLVLLIDGDVGKSLGRVIRHEIAPAADVIAIDGVQLKEFDYVDIGDVIELTNVVPIIIKSLLFK